MAFERVPRHEGVVFCEVKDRVQFKGPDDVLMQGTVYHVDYMRESLPVMIRGADGVEYRGFASEIVENFTQIKIRR